MYHRLCRRIPQASETKPQFAKLDQFVESHANPNNHTGLHKKDFWRRGPSRLLHIPMRHMWLDILGDTLDKFPYARAQDCIIEGHTDLLRHLVDTGRVDLRRIVLIGETQLGESVFYHAIDAAAELGHLDILKMLHEPGCQEASKDAMDGASANGHLNVVKWLHGNRTEGCTTDAMDNAAKNGHLQIVKFLHENRTEGCTTDAMDYAAMNGHLDVVKFLHENRTEGCTAKAMYEATTNGHLDVVEFLHENRIEGNSTDDDDPTDFLAAVGRMTWAYAFTDDDMAMYYHN